MSDFLGSRGRGRLGLPDGQIFGHTTRRDQKPHCYHAKRFRILADSKHNPRHELISREQFGNRAAAVSELNGTTVGQR